jgi:hypothetical protein
MKKVAPVQPREIVAAIVLGVLGLILGAGVAVPAVGMSGAGHGWVSAAISSLSVIGAPLAGMALALRPRRAGRILGSSSLLVAVATDLWLLISTADEGLSYVSYVWRLSAPWVALWALLFISWQVLVLFGFMTTGRR